MRTKAREFQGCKIAHRSRRTRAQTRFLANTLTRSPSRSPSLSRTQVQSFAMDTKEEVAKALSELAALTPQQRLTSVLLDLRGNPGGLLSSAVGVAEVR